MDLDAYFGHAAPPSGEGFKSGFVTLIGRPNAGKSTLLNTIMGKKIAITSNTAQTTRHRFRAVYTRDDMQMIIVDTPGLHKPHDALGEELNTSTLKALEDVDVIAMLIDASKPVGRGDEWVAAQLDGPHCKHAKKICVLSKGDLVTTEQMHEQAEACESQQHNQEDSKETQPPAAKPEKEHPKHAEKETKPVVSETKSKDDKKPESKSKRLPGSKIAAIVALVVVLAAGVAGGVTYQMELWGGKVVPDVTGMAQADATYMLQNKGFTVRSTTVPSDSTEGLVLLMDPGAGARQQEGAEVVIHVSTSRTVPKVVGSSQDSALKALSDNGFENVDVQLERSDEPEGTVLSISPEEGEKAKASTGITLKVAQAYTVPDVSGMSYNQAVQAIKDAGLSSAAVYVYSETASEGAIMGVEPAAGSKVPSDTVVVISLAKSRASELTAAARSYLTSTTLIASDGSSFTVSSVDSVSYQGNDTVAFTASGKASKSVSVLGQTISVAGNSKQVSGTITFDSSNNVASVSFK